MQFSSWTTHLTIDLYSSVIYKRKRYVMTKVLVFDLGGTLMEYMGMPASWEDYYKQGFEALNRYYQCDVSAACIDKSIEILKSFNPRIIYREVEYTPEYIFSKALEHWGKELPIHDCSYKFFQGLKLNAMIYSDTIPALKTLRKKGYQIATLTDLPTAMSDELFKNDIALLLPYFDFYVSSLSCGFRKPNSKGLELIAEHYEIPVKELIFVGDEEKDRKTAYNAGCRFVQIDRKPKGTGDICDLTGITEYIEN